MPLMDLFWTMFAFFILVAWIYVVVMVVVDVFRSRDLSGWAKALWVLGIILVPWLGVLVYLIARGKSMTTRGYEEAAAREQATQDYIRKVAATSAGSSSVADEISRLAELRDAGTLTPAEFDAQKARLLASA
jgi:hypothetical protein